MRACSRALVSSPSIFLNGAPGRSSRFAGEVVSRGGLSPTGPAMAGGGICVPGRRFDWLKFLANARPRRRRQPGVIDDVVKLLMLQCVSNSTSTHFGLVFTLCTYYIEKAKANRCGSRRPKGAWPLSRPSAGYRRGDQRGEEVYPQD